MVRTRSEQRLAVLRSALWHAVAKIAGKEAQRDLLDAGDVYDVEGQVAAHVNGEPISVPISCQVAVNFDTEVSVSVAAPMEHLLALFLAEVPKTRRAKLLDDLPVEFSAAGELPGADPELFNAAAGLLKSLRSRKIQPRRGSVQVRRAA